MTKIKVKYNKNTKGWQHGKSGKRLFVEIRNEFPHPIKVEVVRVRATNNYFIYVRLTNYKNSGVQVPAYYYEVAKIKESNF